MTYETVAEVLDGVIDFHRKASRFYHTLTASVEDDRCLILTEDLVRQHQQQAEALQYYRDTAPIGVLRTELQFAGAKGLWSEPEINQAKDQVQLDAILHAMREIDHTVVELYRQLREERVPPQLTEIFDRMFEQQATIARKHSFDTQALARL